MSIVMRTPARFARAWVCTAVGGCIALMVAVATWAQALEIIELKHRTADDVIPILQPLLERGGALSGQDYKLFVRASSANVSQLRAALAQIDRAPRQLLVSVRRSTRAQIEQERASASFTIAGTDASVAVNERARDRSGVRVQGTASADRNEGDAISSVQVLEGYSASISTGTSVPVVTAVAAGGGRRPWVAGSVEYRNLGSGMLVTPRVRGEQVLLDIEQQHEQLERGNVTTQSLTSQVSGPVGEWIALGGVESSASSTRSGVLQRQYSTSNESMLIWVKVDAL